MARYPAGPESELEDEFEAEFEDELEDEFEAEFEDEGEFELEAELEDELEDEFEDEFEDEDEGEGEEFFGGVARALGGLLGEEEGEDEDEDEAFLGGIARIAGSLLGESEDEDEAEEFFGRIGRAFKKAAPFLRVLAKTAGPLVATAVGGPAAGALARAVTSQLEGEFEEEFEGELEAMATGPSIPQPVHGRVFRGTSSSERVRDRGRGVHWGCLLYIHLAAGPARPRADASGAATRLRCAHPPAAPEPSHAAGGAARARHRRRCGADSRPARRRRRSGRPGRGGPSAGRRNVPRAGRPTQPLLHHAPSRTRPRARPAPAYSLRLDSRPRLCVRQRWLAVWHVRPTGPELSVDRASRRLRDGGRVFPAVRWSVRFLARACPGPQPRCGPEKSCTRPAARLRQSRHPCPGPLPSGTPAADGARGE